MLFFFWVVFHSLRPEIHHWCMFEAIQECVHALKMKHVHTIGHFGCPDTMNQ